MLDTSIDRLTDSVKQATESLQREYKIAPGQIDDLRNKLQEKCVNLSETIKEHETAASEVKNIKAKTLNDYKYIKAKTNLYSEPYRNIVSEKIKHINANYQVDRELNTLSKEDKQKIYDRLPDGMKDRFQKHIQEQPQEQTQRQTQNHTKGLER